MSGIPQVTIPSSSATALASTSFPSSVLQEYSINKITPHDICTAILISITQDPSSKHLVQNNNNNNSLEQVNKFIIDCIQHKVTPVYGNVHKFIAELTHKTNSDIIIQRFVLLYNTIDTVDALMSLFDSLKSIDANKTSIYGIFLRKIILLFNNLLFDGVKTLFDSIIRFKSSNSQVLLLNNDSIESNSKRSTSSALLKKSSTSSNNTGINPTSSNSSSNPLNVSKIFPKLYYSNYVQSCRELDFINANFYVHIYYDYFQNRSYSALNKSLLYYHFKYYKQATISLKESIKISQQNNEHDCLLLSFIILYKIKMIEYFHQVSNQSNSTTSTTNTPNSNSNSNNPIAVELFILQALRFAQSHNTSILFYITLDFIQFKLLSGFNHQTTCQQIFALIRRCEQLQQQNSLDLHHNQQSTKPLLLIELFPKSVLTNVKAHFYRLLGDKMLYNCHSRLSVRNHQPTTTIPLVAGASAATGGGGGGGYTKSTIDLYSDYELLSSRSIPTTSDSSCYRLLITHFIELRDRVNVNLLLNQYKNIMDNTLSIDRCDLLYLESLIAYHLDNNIHEAVTKMKLCFKSSTQFNFIQLLTVYLSNCELLKNEESCALLLPYLLKAIDFCEKNCFETHKNRLLLYLYRDVDYLTNPSNLLTHGSQTDIAYYYELRGLKHNRVDDLKIALSNYLKSFCLAKSQQLCYKLAHLTKDVSYCKLYTSIHKELNTTKSPPLNNLFNQQSSDSIASTTSLPTSSPPALCSSLDTQMDRSLSYFKTLIQSLLKTLP